MTGFLLTAKQKLMLCINKRLYRCNGSDGSDRSNRSDWAERCNGPNRSDRCNRFDWSHRSNRRGGRNSLS